MSSARARNPFGDDDDGQYKFGNKGDQNGSGEDELKKIHEQIGRVENESLSSTQRALRALNEAEEVGTKTAAELVSQGEKLQKIEETMDGVNEKLNSTQKNLNQLKGFFGGFKRNKDGSKSFQSIFKAGQKEKEKEATVHSSASQGSMSSQQQSQAARPQFATITGSDREAEINKNLDLMSDGLGRLKNLSLDMQNELNRQDPLIGRLTAKTDATQTRIDSQNTQMKKILK